MPEGPEVTILSQYLLTKLEGRIIEKMEILSGKYSNNKMDNHDLLDGSNEYQVESIDSKGKLMWMTLKNIKTNEKIYLTSHLGLTGFWGFSEGKNDRLKFTIKDKDKDNKKKYFLYYEDDRNFGNIEIYKYQEKKDLDKKIDDLAIDALKGEYDIDDFVKVYNAFLTKSKKRKEQNITLVLMKQKKSDGIVSGIGNYLVAEILYEAKISPFRTAGSLSDDEIRNLGKAIQYLTKLSYYDNTTGYMTHFDDFIDVHKERIKKSIYPDFHKHIKIKKGEKFEFKVYRQKKDPDGNPVEADKSIQKTRSTYYVPNVQKLS
jgi:formamidopyrimidine-DNA glycosylase